MQRERERLCQAGMAVSPAQGARARTCRHPPRQRRRISKLLRPRTHKQVVAQVGPEPRPFPALRALDLEAVAQQVLAKLEEV